MDVLEIAKFIVNFGIAVPAIMAMGWYIWKKDKASEALAQAQELRIAAIQKAHEERVASILKAHEEERTELIASWKAESAGRINDATRTQVLLGEMQTKAHQAAMSIDEAAKRDGLTREAIGMVKDLVKFRDEQEDLTKDAIRQTGGNSPFRGPARGGSPK